MKAAASHHIAIVVLENKNNHSACVSVCIKTRSIVVCKQRGTYIITPSVVSVLVMVLAHTA